LRAAERAGRHSGPRSHPPAPPQWPPRPPGPSPASPAAPAVGPACRRGSRAAHSWPSLCRLCQPRTSRLSLRERRQTASTAAASKVKSWNNLKTIGLAINDYHANHRRLPGPIRDKQGHALLSWRVTILPYVEAAPSRHDFHLDEPWDSPHNLTYLNDMPRFY